MLVSPQNSLFNQNNFAFSESSVSFHENLQPPVPVVPQPQSQPHFRGGHGGHQGSSSSSSSVPAAIRAEPNNAGGGQGSASAGSWMSGMKFVFKSFRKLKNQKAF